MKKIGLAVLFAVGVLMAITVNVQLTLSMVLIAISYAELRKEGVDLTQIDDILLDKLREIVNKGTDNEQK